MSDQNYNASLLEVPINSIKTNPFQPRRQFAEEELQELAQSIQAVGLIHPPLVRVLEDGFYEIISGERRYQACRLAGLKTIKVVTSGSDTYQSAQMALIENIQRVDLNPLEVAKAIKELLEKFNLNQNSVAEQLGKKRSTIANYLRLLSLPSTIQQSLLAETITMGHAKAILSLEDEEKQVLLHQIILRDTLSVRDAESMAKKIATKARQKKLKYVNSNFFLKQLAEKVQNHLGTKVEMQERIKGKGGRITIDYYSYDDLDRLLKLLGVPDGN
jgi:ParB family chromosome partitioning protein